MPKYRYDVVVGFYGQDMIDELNAKGKKGYRLATAVLNTKLDAPIVAFMEAPLRATRPKKKTQQQQRARSAR